MTPCRGEEGVSLTCRTLLNSHGAPWSSLNLFLPKDDRQMKPNEETFVDRYQYLGRVWPPVSKIAFHWSQSAVRCNCSNLPREQWSASAMVNRRVYVGILSGWLDWHLVRDWNRLAERKKASVFVGEQWSQETEKRTWADFCPPCFRATRENLRLAVGVIVSPFVDGPVSDDMAVVSEGKK